MDGYSPYPVGEVADALGFPKSEMGAVMFIGGLIGAVLRLPACSTGPTPIDYPLNVGGQPYFSLAVVHPDHVGDCWC